MKSSSIFAVLAFLGVYFLGHAEAWAQASVASVVEELVEVRQANGALTTVRQSADNITPGDLIAYTYRISNAQTAPVERVVVTAQVSPALAIQLQSIPAEGFDVTYSVDGGRSFAALANLTMTEAGQPRPARAEDISHVRWIRLAPLPVGAEDQCGFTAVVR